MRSFFSRILPIFLVLQVPEQMAKGCLELRSQLQHFYGSSWWDHADRITVDNILQSFFLSRIGIRFLLEQQLVLHDQIIDGAVMPADVFGLLSLNVKARDIADIAVAKACRNCKASVGVKPEVGPTPPLSQMLGLFVCASSATSSLCANFACPLMSCCILSVRCSAGGGGGIWGWGGFRRREAPKKFCSGPKFVWGLWGVCGRSTQTMCSFSASFIKTAIWYPSRGMLFGML